MGYMSTVHGELLVKLPQKDHKAPSESFLKEAEELGVKLDFNKPPVFPSADDLKDFINKSFTIDDKTFWIDSVTNYPLDNNVYTLKYRNEGKAYNIKEDIKAVVDLLAEKECIVNGVIFIKGEDWDDISRVVVTDNSVSHERAEVTAVFSDGSKYDENGE